MKRKFSSGVVAGICIVVAILAIAAVIFSNVSAGKGNECTGKSCEPLPSQAVACEGPAGEPGRNPHCNPNPTATQVPPTPTRVLPTATQVPPTATTTGESYLRVSTTYPYTCVDNICPPVECSEATKAAVAVEWLALEKAKATDQAKP